MQNVCKYSGNLIYYEKALMILRVLQYRWLKREGMGERWSEDMSIAWAKAYDELALAIKKEMRDGVDEVSTI